MKNLLKKSKVKYPTCYSCKRIRRDAKEIYHIVDYINKNDEGIVEEWLRFFCTKCYGDYKKTTK